MPRLSKRVIANFLRSGCMRRLRLDLTPDSGAYVHERANEGMPPRLVRPGLTALAQAGVDWEHEKTNDLIGTFGAAAVAGNRQPLANGMFKFKAEPLGNLLATARPGTFLAQPEYVVGASFETAVGAAHLRGAHGLDYSALVPDIIQVWSPGKATREVLPDGSVQDVPAADQRVPLRVIDIKLTAEPSVPYFGELTYYSMVLAGWLRDLGLNGRFVVVPEAAVWPGSHDASSLVRLQAERRAVGAAPTPQELSDALDEDLETTEFGVFAPRLRRFFQDELPRALATAWHALPWHVDNRCIGCEYLGYPWPGAPPDPSHCWPEANTVDHLSRVAFVTRGARGVLEDQNIGSVSMLAGTPPTNAAYDEHHLLRATRTVVSSRAQSLQTGQAVIPQQAGTSAVMPRWADLRIYLTADFDIGSGITIAFGFKAFYWSQQQTQSWGPQVFAVDQRDLVAERRELLDLLGAIHVALQWARTTSAGATVQVFVWDTVTYEHLTRVIGRHLGELLLNRVLAQLAWLFPPESVVANPDISDRSSPITLVREVIRAVVAAPVPHYYSLLNVAREYHPAAMQAPYNQFSVHPLFEDPLSDQIPSERAHEIWSRRGGGRPWLQQLDTVRRTVTVKLDALEKVTRRVSDDLGAQLNQTAPRIADLSPPSLPQRMADDARLWFVFTKLNVALTRLEVQEVRAMPPHEREARFKSAHLVQRLSGQAEQQALARLGVVAGPYTWVYELGPLSKELRARDGDFDFALAPRSAPGFLDQRLHRLVGGQFVPVPTWNGAQYSGMERVTSVTVSALDRDAGLIAVDLKADWGPTVLRLERLGLVDLSQDVMLDPVHLDFLIRKLEPTLNAIGNPPVAVAHPSVPAALNRTRRARAGAASPVGDLLWDAPNHYAAVVNRVLAPVKALLQGAGYDLNSSQWTAWDESLTHRFRLVWGPPGTGKSRTLRTVVLGALHEAVQQRRPLRVLVTGPTYEAIDNVLLEVNAALCADPLLRLPQVRVGRLRSPTRHASPNVPGTIDIEVSNQNQDYQTLRHRLEQAREITLVGATVQQAHKLFTDAGGPVVNLFDLIVVDEASQVDVAQATLGLTGLAASGAVVIAGDPKQLPPIHQAEPPVGLEYMVGSVFAYFEQRFQIPACPLEENYRSCSTIVELAHAAGYRRSLRAVSPGLRLDLTQALPNAGNPPPGWPTALLWTPDWSRLLDPAQPAVSFVYPEGRSSQWNLFEAEAIAALAWLLWARLGDQLQGEFDPATGGTIPVSGSAYGQQDFWQRGIGIVTPHRAQQALVNAVLQRTFPGHQPQLLRDAVDTVERFQGQQRDVMLVSFALGDPDAIGTEDEFLLSLNRFNVMASRARAKLIVLVSQEVVDHLSSDLDVLKGSALLKTFVETFCHQAQPMRLGYVKRGAAQAVDGVFRWRP